MKVAKDILRLVARLVSHHASYDKFSDTYNLSVNNLSDFEINELAALFMLDDDLASEANGPDNPAYQKTMLPSLLRYMSNSTSRDEEIEFNRSWRNGVASYFHNMIQELIDEQCSNYIYDIRHDAGLYAHKKSDNGETYWSRHP